MGQSCQRNFQACCDPEGTAAIVRKKKAQRAAINKYKELINEVNTSLDQGRREAAQDFLQDIERYDKETAQRGINPGDFEKGLHAHADWPEIINLRNDMNQKLRAI